MLDTDQIAATTEKNSDVRNILNVTDTGDGLWPIYRDLRSTLTDKGKRNLFVVALTVAPTETVRGVLRAAEFKMGDPPSVFFESYAEEAKDWVRFADIEERKHYLSAIWHSLPMKQQHAFMRYIARLDMS